MNDAKGTVCGSELLDARFRLLAALLSGFMIVILEGGRNERPLGGEARAPTKEFEVA